MLLSNVHSTRRNGRGSEMEQPTTATKAWSGGVASALASGIVTAVAQYMMLDLPIETNATLVAALTGAISTATVYFTRNKPKAVA